MFKKVLRGQYGYVSDREGPAMVAEALLARPGDAGSAPWRILDLGCGTGNTSVPYFERAGRFAVVGVDLTPEMVEKAKERPFERVICQNIEKELQVDDGSFDAVQFIGVCEFLTRPEETFSMVRRKLRPDGLLLLTSPRKIMEKFEKKYKIKTWATGELEALVAKAGFRQVANRSFLAYDLGDVKVNYECSLWQRTE